MGTRFSSGPPHVELALHLRNPIKTRFFPMKIVLATPEAQFQRLDTHYRYIATTKTDLNLVLLHKTAIAKTRLSRFSGEGPRQSDGVGS